MTTFQQFRKLILCTSFIAVLTPVVPVLAATTPVKTSSKPEVRGMLIPLNRSTLITLGSPMAEVMVANPDIADVHAHNEKSMTIVAKRLGHTNVRAFDKDGNLLREIEVTVGYDLPEIRRSLKNFMPDETIGVEMVNTSIALTGQVSNASSVDKAIKIVKDFIRPDDPKEAAKQVRSNEDQIKDSEPDILNLLQVTSGQQVMLRVRVGEINREALKTLGVDLNAVSTVSGNATFSLGTGGGIGSLVAPSSTSEPTLSPGQFLLPGGRTPTDTRGVFTSVWRPGAGTFGGLIKALERDGLFKLLAEPNLVAVSGEEAEFLAGGEIPIPVVQGGATSNNVTIEYKPFGVAVKFTPFVLSENRIRMSVQPEVSEISAENAVKVSNFEIPSISTRRAKTTVELAPGESFMIAGLIKDQMRATIDQVPGAKELPVIGALLRSNEFRRNETELVIAVTPYVVDPVKGADVKLPTDNFRPASQMDMFFYGRIGGIQNKTDTQGLEGPSGFMVD